MRLTRLYSRRPGSRNGAIPVFETDGTWFLFVVSALRLTLEEKVPITCRPVSVPRWTNRVHDSHRVRTSCTPREGLEGRAIEVERYCKLRSPHVWWFATDNRRFLAGETNGARWTWLFASAQSERRYIPQGARTSNGSPLPQAIRKDWRLSRGKNEIPFYTLRKKQGKDLIRSFRKPLHTNRGTSLSRCEQTEVLRLSLSPQPLPTEPKEAPNQD